MRGVPLWRRPRNSTTGQTEQEPAGVKYRDFGRTGIRVSEIGFGAWALGGGWGPQSDDDSLAALDRAVDLGVNFIDTAAFYGNGRSEQIIGQLLKCRPEKLFVATKTPPAAGPWPPSPYCRAEDRYSESYLRENVDRRREMLGVDCIDLLQLHTWTRAWNRSPRPLDTLRKLQAEGKIKYIGISTPEQDQNSVIDLMRRGYLDAIQVIYNIFEQEPAAELLPAAEECGVGVIVRVALDEGSLTGKYRRGHRFAPDDFRSKYFAGDRIDRTVARVERMEADVAPLLPADRRSMAEVALRFALAHPAVSTVIAGIRNVAQAEANTRVSDLDPLPEPVLLKLREHAWLRGVWYSGK
ncbi:MAG: aldo/keto reductase [Pirellulales bacterium]|nr:aldo/keto reductase [Pirellulales bacterium]